MLEFLRRGQRHLLLGDDGSVCELADGALVHADFAAWCAAHPRQACTLWLCGGGLHDLLPDPALPPPPAASLLDWARRLVLHYHGLAAQDWPLAAWRIGGVRGASAWRGALRPLRETAAAHGVRLRGVRPAWPLLLRHLLKLRPSLAGQAHAEALLVEASTLVCVTLRRGRVVAVRRRRLDEPRAAALEAVVAQQAVSADPSTIRAVLWLGAAPVVSARLDIAAELEPPYAPLQRAARSAPAADFLMPQARRPALAWAWLGSTLLVLAVAAADAWQARRDLDAAVAVVPVAAPRALARAVPARSAGPVATSRSGAERSVRRLEHPWGAVFAASEVPTAGVAWLALQHSGSELRLSGLAEQRSQAQDAAATLARSQRWSQVLLARVEEVPQPGGNGVRFELVARLAGAQP